MKVAVIINPRAGKRRIDRLDTLIETKFGDSLAEIAHTCYPGHATQLAREAAKRGIDTVVAVGGDGLVNEMLNGIIGSPVALGIVPTGTANDLAEFCGIPKDLNRACDVIAAGKTRTVDAVSVNGWHYLTAGGIGLPCIALAVVEAIRRHRMIGRWVTLALGSKIYMFAAICGYYKARKFSPSLQVRVHDRSRQVEAFSFIISNLPRLGRNFIIAPGAANDDGLFDICAIEKCASRRLLVRAVLKTLRGTQQEMPNVSISRARSVVIDATRPLRFFGDGQLTEPNNRFVIEIVPQARAVLVPGDEGGDSHVD